METELLSVISSFMLFTTSIEGVYCGYIRVPENTRCNDMSRRGLVLVPDLSVIPSNTQALDLSINNISSLLGSNFEGLPALQYLSLSYYSITTLSNFSWIGLSSLKELYLIYNRITSLKGVSWDGLSSLKNLFLRGNYLTSLAEVTWVGLYSLRGLFLQANYLTSLAEVTWVGLHSLRELSLRWNNLTSLKGATWFGLSSLERLVLYHNKIYSLEGTHFTELSSLEKLDLNNNIISSLAGTDFKGLSSLKELDLSFNNISSLAGTDFSRLSSLKELDLGYNIISSLTGTDFTGLSSLKELDIRHNNISSLSGTDFTGLSSLKKLRLYGNPINCSLFCLPSFIAERNSHMCGIKICEETPPVFIKKPTNLTVVEDADARFPCEVSGTPKPLVIWKKIKDGVESEVIPGGRYQIQRTGELLIITTNPNDSARFYCNASNSQGSVSAIAYLNVYQTTQIIQPPPAITEIIKGSVASLQCGVSHDVNVNVTWHWYRGLTELSPSVRFTVEQDGTLKILDVYSGDNGEYKCEVISTGGNDSRTTQLKIIEFTTIFFQETSKVKIITTESASSAKESSEDTTVTIETTSSAKKSSEDTSIGTPTSSQKNEDDDTNVIIYTTATLGGGGVFGVLLGLIAKILVAYCKRERRSEIHVNNVQNIVHLDHMNQKDN